jgi:hypothetical protein
LARDPLGPAIVWQKYLCLFVEDRTSSKLECNGGKQHKGDAAD